MEHMNVVFIIAATNRRKLAYVGHAIAEISQFFVFLAKCKILPENFLGGGGKFFDLLYRVCQKTGHRVMTTILSILNRFKNFFH